MELPALSTGEVVLRVLIAALLGGVIGFEREFSDQPAGFRTHILVSLGAALFTLVGAYGVNAFTGAGTQGAVRFDPTRVAAQVVTGIGFLGAGAILRQGINVRGLTTAAALWVTAAVGVAVGLGYWTGAVATSVVTVVALYGLKRLEGLIFPRLRQGRVRYAVRIGPDLRVTELTEAIEAFHARVVSMKLGEDEHGHKVLIAIVSLPETQSPDALADDVRDIDGVQSVEWSS